MRAHMTVEGRLFFHHEMIENDFSCFFITDNRRILHLTFSKERHLAALRRLTEWFPEITTEKYPGGIIASQVRACLQGELRPLPLPAPAPFLLAGTAFQQRVWQQIAAIPYGQTKTYGELAELLRQKGAARAVGQACNANPLALLIPCHRVVGVGGLGGFAGGVEVKKRLLQMEKT